MVKLKEVDVLKLFAKGLYYAAVGCFICFLYRF